MAFLLSASVKQCRSCAYLSGLREVSGVCEGHVTKSRLSPTLVWSLRYSVSKHVHLANCQPRRRTFSVLGNRHVNRVSDRLAYARQYNTAYDGVAVRLEQSARSTDGNDQNKSRKSDNTSTKSKTKKKRLVENEWIKPEGLDTGIMIYNSLTRKKEPLILPAGRLATWYACGPTVYDHAHIGHASSYVRTDIIRRVLMKFFNIDVVMVMGITDIDDKIIKRSKETGVDFRHLARYFEVEFFKDMDSLKVLAPTVKTRVSEHIPHIIAFIQQIMKNGYGYVTSDGTVYFDVQKYGHYGKLYAHTDGDESEIRVQVDTGKRSARDFALWKAAKPEEPWWDSPWGKGRPGWHIECSTMASTIFGSHLDIHSGGDDLKFPHHENELAQSEACFCSNQWTNYWLHTGLLHQKDDKAKMSKSLRNTVRVSDLLKQYTANQFRLFCMLRPYRQLVEYNEESMQKAIHIHNQWATFQTTSDAYIRGQILCKPINDVYLLESLEETKKKVESSLADDFDTPKAVAALEELVRRANVELAQKAKSEAESSVRSPGVIAAVAAYVDRIMDLFGIQVSRKKKLSQTDSEQKLSAVMDSVVKFRSDVRQFALNPELPEISSDILEKERKQKAQQFVQPLFQACDSLRDDLKVVGIQIQDHNKQSSWDVVEQASIPPGKSNQQE